MPPPLWIIPIDNLTPVSLTARQLSDFDSSRSCRAYHDQQGSDLASTLLELCHASRFFSDTYYNGHTTSELDQYHKRHRVRLSQSRDGKCQQHGLRYTLSYPQHSFSSPPARLHARSIMAEEARQRRRSNGVVPEPEPAHTRRSDAESDSDNDREATELQDVTSPPEQRRLSRILSPPARPQSHWYDGGRKFWRHNVRITVPHDDCRDHLGKAYSAFFVILSNPLLSRYQSKFLLRSYSLMPLLTTTTNIRPLQPTSAHSWATCVPPSRSPC